MGLSPGGREGVLLASIGSGGNASAGGGDVGEANGLVIYEASEPIDGIGSRNPPLRRRVPLLAFPGDRPV